MRPLRSYSRLGIMGVALLDGLVGRKRVLGGRVDGERESD